MMDVLRTSGLAGLKRLEPSVGGALSVGSASGTLAIQKAGRIDEMEQLRSVAKSRFIDDHDCEVIVMGHTHQPDHQKFGKGCYYNPGSWTRYADISQQTSLTLDMLKDETKFPYQLNYVWVEMAADGRLLSEMKPFEVEAGKPF